MDMVDFSGQSNDQTKEFTVTTRKELGVGSHTFGEASVLDAAAQMLRMGLIPLKPIVDDHGVDLYVVEGTKVCRIQVKASSLITRTKPGRKNPGSPYYEFELKHVRSTYESGIRSLTQKFSEKTDFVVLHAVEDDVFLVVPATILDDKRSIRYSREQRSRDVDMDEMRKDRESGMTFEKLGEKYGMSAPTAYQRLAGIHGTAHGDLTKEVRSYINRWDLIAEFFET